MINDHNDHNDGSNNDSDNKEEDDSDDNSDDNSDDVQAEGWIGAEAEKEVESGVIADDHIYQSA